MIAGRECPLCGGPGEPVGNRNGCLIRQCRCEGRSLLSWQWPSVTDYESWYSAGSGYHVQEQIREGQDPCVDADHLAMAAASARLAPILALHPGKRSLLDVGCGTGALVQVAEAHGMTACGIEPNPEMVAVARQRGRHVSLGDWRYAEGLWDVVCLLDVLEHLVDPLNALRHLAAVLADGGVLVVEMPEWGSAQASAAGIAWKHVRPRQHLWLPDQRAAEEAFRRCFLRVDAVIRPKRGGLGKIAYYLGRE